MQYIRTLATIKVRKSTVIFLTMFICQISFGQTKDEKDYLDSNNWIQMDKISVRQFVEELRTPAEKPEYPKNIINILHTVGQRDTNWISIHDIEYLMTLIDSEEEAKCIMRVISSYVPLEEKPTLGDQIILLINAYRKKMAFPYRLTLCGDFGDNERAEIKDWWEKEKIKNKTCSQQHVYGTAPYEMLHSIHYSLGFISKDVAKQ